MGNKTMMDSTRLTQWGNWNGHINHRTLDKMLGTKDRSWGVRPIGAPTPAAPQLTLPQIFFLWAPLHFDDYCTHFLCFERENGDRWASDAALVEVVSDGDPLFGAEAEKRIHHLAGASAIYYGDDRVGAIPQHAHRRLRGERAKRTLRQNPFLNSQEVLRGVGAL